MEKRKLQLPWSDEVLGYYVRVLQLEPGQGDNCIEKRRRQEILTYDGDLFLLLIESTVMR